MGRDLVIPIVITTAFLLTWAAFPEIGDEHTSVALGPWFSYLWPIGLVWFAVLAVRNTETALQGKLDGLPSFAFNTLLILLGATWGFGVWHALITSKSRFFSEFLPFFAVALGGLPVLGCYWGASITTILVFGACVSRFAPGIRPRFVHEPTSTIDYSHSSDLSTDHSLASDPPLEFTESVVESEGDEKLDNEDRDERRSNGAGYLYRGSSTLGSPIGTYEDGYIYRGSGTIWAPIGMYEDRYIYQGVSSLAAPVGIYEDGYIYRGYTTLGAPIGIYEDGYIYRGYSTLGAPVGTYEGSDEGAVAASVLLGLLD